MLFIDIVSEYVRYLWILLVLLFASSNLPPSFYSARMISLLALTDGLKPVDVHYILTQQIS